MTRTFEQRGHEGICAPLQVQNVHLDVVMGMADSDPLPVGPILPTSGMFVGDVISGHGTTALIAAARTAGRGTATGEPMVEAAQELMVDFVQGDPAGASRQTGALSR